MTAAPRTGRDDVELVINWGLGVDSTAYPVQVLEEPRRSGPDTAAPIPLPPRHISNTSSSRAACSWPSSAPAARHETSTSSGKPSPAKTPRSSDESGQSPQPKSTTASRSTAQASEPRRFETTAATTDSDSSCPPQSPAHNSNSNSTSVSATHHPPAPTHRLPTTTGSRDLHHPRLPTRHRHRRETVHRHRTRRPQHPRPGLRRPLPPANCQYPPRRRGIHRTRSHRSPPTDHLTTTQLKHHRPPPATTALLHRMATTPRPCRHRLCNQLRGHGRVVTAFADPPISGKHWDPDNARWT
jgi:hypothetical protein